MLFFSALTVFEWEKLLTTNHVQSVSGQIRVNIHRILGGNLLTQNVHQHFGGLLKHLNKLLQDGKMEGWSENLPAGPPLFP